MMTEPTEVGISKQPKELCHHWSQQILWCKIKVEKYLHIQSKLPKQPPLLSSHLSYAAILFPPDEKSYIIALKRAVTCLTWSAVIVF